jgi:hypothetical protein
MNIEFVEFYMTDINEDKSYFSGTLHVYLPDEDTDLRGIVVIFKNENWNFFLPHKMTTGTDGKKVRYPVYSKRDRNQSKALLQKVIEHGNAFVAQKMNIML